MSANESDVMFDLPFLFQSEASGKVRHEVRPTAPVNSVP